MAIKTVEILETRKNLEPHLGCPNMPSMFILMLAYARHTMAQSRASEDFSQQQPAPPDCHILVLVVSRRCWSTATARVLASQAEAIVVL